MIRVVNQQITDKAPLMFVLLWLCYLWGVRFKGVVNSAKRSCKIPQISKFINTPLTLELHKTKHLKQFFLNTRFKDPLRGSFCSPAGMKRDHTVMDKSCFTSLLVILLTNL